MYASLIYAITGLDTNLLSVQHQAIIETNGDLFTTRGPRIKFSENQTYPNERRNTSVNVIHSAGRFISASMILI